MYIWNTLNPKVKLQNDVIFEVLVVVTVKVAALCFLLDIHPCFGEMY
jgi:hypothetical protein